MLSVHWGVTPLTGSILFNVYVVLLAIVLLWQGTVTKRVGLVNGCIFTFLAMIAARFFDPTFSFVERGFTFMVTGVAIFAVNLFYMWRKAIATGAGEYIGSQSQSTFYVVAKPWVMMNILK